jgi:plastocyanin
LLIADKPEVEGTMAAINIRRVNGRAVFDPPVLVGATVGDRIFWRNLDPAEQHWITPKGKPQDYWFRSPLAPFVRGQPADTTTDVVLQQEVPIMYVCSIHQEETGEIRFSSAIV